MSDEKKTDPTPDSQAKSIPLSGTETAKPKVPGSDTKARDSAASAQSPDTHSKRIRFGSTETSRLKATGAESQGERDSVSLPTTPKPAIKPAPGRTSVVDPMTLRDTNTSKVKRVQASKDSSPLATISLPGSSSPIQKTETVQLKVVQQKKKELDDEMNPAGTVRLKSPAGGGPSISIPKPKGSSSSRDTMKISLPKLAREKPSAGDDAEDSSTVQVKPIAPTVPVVAPSDTAKPPAGADTVTPAEPVKTSTTILEKTRPQKKDGEGSADETASAVSKETAATIAAPKPGSGRTLKIRSGGRTAKTLKVKSGSSDQTVPVEDLPEGGEARTVKVDSPSGGLKLKTRETPLGEGAMAGAEPAVRQHVDRQNPGILYTLGAAASFLALCTTAYFVVKQAIAYIF